MEEVSVGVEDIRVGLQGHLVENWFIGGMWTQSKESAPIGRGFINSLPIGEQGPAPKGAGQGVVPLL